MMRFKYHIQHSNLKKLCEISASVRTLNKWNNFLLTLTNCSYCVIEQNSVLISDIDKYFKTMFTFGKKYPSQKRQYFNNDAIRELNEVICVREKKNRISSIFFRIVEFFVIKIRAVESVENMIDSNSKSDSGNLSESDSMLTNIVLLLVKVMRDHKKNKANI